MTGFRRYIRYFPKYPSLIASVLITLFFCFLVATDLTPLVRGPVPWPNGWRWEYQFINTFSQIYAPVFLGLCITFLFLFYESHKATFKKKETLGILILILFHFLFILSVFFFSRAGISVLVNRIMDPHLNGYFTTSLNVESFSDFMSGYVKNVEYFPGHAQSHPPGGVLPFWAFNMVVEKMPIVRNLGEYFHPSRGDVMTAWNNLNSTEQSSVLLLSLFIPLLSSFVIFPFYFLVKKMYGFTIALRASFLYALLPNVIFFNPLNDVLLAVFPIASLYFLFETKSMTRIFLGGVILSLGMFVSMSLAPFVMFVGLCVVYNTWKNHASLKKIYQSCLIFSFGCLSLPFLLDLLFGYNTIDLMLQVTGILPRRPYFTWLFYLPYDLFIFTGLPTVIFFILGAKDVFKNFLLGAWVKIDVSYFIFIIMLLTLNFSGRIQGEIGRILMPLSPFIVIFATQYLTGRLKLKKYQFVLLIIIQLTQILVMQEFWIMGEYADFGKSDEQCFTLSGRCK